jgi:hypothetical protein
VLAYDPENLEAILARSKASKAAGRKLEALALLESGDCMASTENHGANNYKDSKS